ncbi:MAG: hypothetical protein V1827_01150 [Candidatus Micrarchaeota archaeon]
MATLKQSPENPQRTAMAGRFGRYAPEKDSEVRETKARSNPEMEKMLELFASIPYQEKTLNNCGPVSLKEDRNYMNLIKILGQARFDSAFISEFCIAVTPFQQIDYFAPRLGIFLSALTTLCDGDNVDIVTSHLPHPPEFLCFRNHRHHVIIHGHAGAFLGAELSGGSLTVEGDASWIIGDRMIGGKIEAQNVTPLIHSFPNPVEIEVFIDLHIGRHMKGGEMRFGSVSPGLETGIEHGTIEHGKIYVDGKLEVDK